MAKVNKTTGVSTERLPPQSQTPHKIEEIKLENVNKISLESSPSKCDLTILNPKLEFDFENFNT